MMEGALEFRLRRILGVVLALVVCGCASPEDGRLRAGGKGGDGGNYRDKPIHAPSKLDGTKAMPQTPPGNPKS
jgi:hypothetical protein